MLRLLLTGNVGAVKRSKSTESRPSSERCRLPLGWVVGVGASELLLSALLMTLQKWTNSHLFAHDDQVAPEQWVVVVVLSVAAGAAGVTCWRNRRDLWAMIVVGAIFVTNVYWSGRVLALYCEGCAECG